jgi:hypothetical protein
MRSCGDRVGRSMMAKPRFGVKPTLERVGARFEEQDGCAIRVADKLTLRCSGMHDTTPTRGHAGGIEEHKVGRQHRVPMVWARTEERPSDAFPGMHKPALDALPCGWAGDGAAEAK